jgi:hypothetical protein
LTEQEVARVFAWLKQRVGQAEPMWPSIGLLEQHIKALREQTDRMSIELNRLQLAALSGDNSSNP